MSPVKTAISSAPRFAEQTKELLKECKKLDQATLKKMFSVSAAVAALNHERYQTFEAQEEKQAVVAFDGPAYRGLDAHSFSEQDQEFAQAHVRILCGLYGVLRPYDRIRPYRLEMSNSLSTAKGSNLYQFWGHEISQLIDADMGHHGQGPRLVVNCASQEYFKALRPAALSPGTEVVTCQFPGATVFAKRARGMMVRHVITNRVTSAEGLKTFEGWGSDRYAFDHSQSNDTILVFNRLKALAEPKARTKANLKPKAAPPTGKTSLSSSDSAQDSAGLPVPVTVAASLSQAASARAGQGRAKRKREGEPAEPEPGAQPASASHGHGRAGRRRKLAT